MSTATEEPVQGTWKETFRQLWDHGRQAYKDGAHDAKSMFNEEQVRQLASFGYTPVEMFDFCDDSVRYEDGPTYDWALAVAEVRHEYFIKVQNGNCCETPISMDDLPPKDDASAGGIPWLSRLIAKARAKLAGRMPDDLMYGCGGDRNFFRTHNVDPAEFLRVAWKAGSDNQPMIDYVKSCQ